LRLLSQMFSAKLMIDRTLWRTGVSVFLVLCLAICLPAPSLSASTKSRIPSKVRDKREQFTRSILLDQAEFAAELEKIALYCKENELGLEAEEIRKLTKPLAANVVQGENLPRQVQLEIPRNLPDVERNWRVRLRTTRAEYAAKLFGRATKAIDAGWISLAYDLVRECARHDSDHKAARRLLGYVRHGNEWVTVYTDKMLNQKYQWHDQFGWLKADQVEHYEQGERFFKGVWMSAQKESELRRDFKDAWVVRTDHFKIHTNHSLEMGVELGKRLEDFYRVFFQTFAGFVSTRGELQKLFSGSSSSTAISEPFLVHYYRTKEDYVIRLQKTGLRNIDKTTGMYLSADSPTGKGIAHFFHNTEVSQEDRLSTMFHEATHQLFSEAYTGGRNKRVGVYSDFWAIEGIACYMESYQKQGETFSLGDPKYIRFQNAQYRLLTDNYFVPLQSLSSMGAEVFQNDSNIEKNYSQGAGLAHFFMHYENGLYRDEFIAYLSGIYSKIERVRNRPPKLDQLTQTKFNELDQQYRDYITEIKTE
jgi:hypothetical protein